MRINGLVVAFTVVQSVLLLWVNAMYSLFYENTFIFSFSVVRCHPLHGGAKTVKSTTSAHQFQTFIRLHKLMIRVIFPIASRVFRRFDDIAISCVCLVSVFNSNIWKMEHGCENSTTQLGKFIVRFWKSIQIG